jgi:hypothetical protein
VLIICAALRLLLLKRVENLGVYRILKETGLLSLSSGRNRSGAARFWHNRNSSLLIPPSGQTGLQNILAGWNPRGECGRTPCSVKPCRLWRPPASSRALVALAIERAELRPAIHRCSLFGSCLPQQARRFHIIPDSIPVSNSSRYFRECIFTPGWNIGEGHHCPPTIFSDG